MPDFRRATVPDPDCVASRLLRSGNGTVAEVVWPIVGKPTSITAGLVGAQLLPKIAIDAACRMVKAGFAKDVLVMLDGDELWDAAWDRLV